MKSLIIIVSAVAVIITAVTIIIGSQRFDGLVVEKPYETGLAWDEMHRNQERLGWTASLRERALKAGRNELLLEVRDRSGAYLNDAQVSLTVRRPSSADHDRTYSAVQVGGGRYQAAVDLPLPGAWDLDADISRGRDQCRIRLRITAGS